jgi:hypothetical protein
MLSPGAHWGADVGAGLGGLIPITVSELAELTLVDPARTGTDR